MSNNKKELGKEILDNMDLTKEQYLELCNLIDELELEKINPNNN